MISEISNFDRQVAARTLAQEARGEPLDGQQAVAWTLRNRLEDGRWGASLSSVCLWPHQFSGWANQHDPNFAYACGLSDNDPMLSHMQSVLQAALDATTDPTNGATHYYAMSISAPGWTGGATPCGKFGHQLFFKGVR